MATTLKIQDGTLFVAENIVKITDNGTDTITFYTVDGNNTAINVGSANLVAVRAQVDNAISAPGDSGLVPPLDAPGFEVQWSTDGSTYNAMPAPLSTSVYIQVTSTNLDLSTTSSMIINFSTGGQSSDVSGATSTVATSTSTFNTPASTGAADLVLYPVTPDPIATIPGGVTYA